MPTYKTSVAIEASRDAVWRLLSAVVAWPTWLPTVTSVEPLEGETLESGRRFRVLQPKLRPATWIVSKLEANRRFEWRSAAPGVLMIADHVIEDLGGCETSVSLRFEFRGPIGILLGLLYGAKTRRYISQEAASLKAAAEHPRRPT